MFYLANISDARIKASYKTLDGVPINGFTVIDVPETVDIDPEDVTISPPLLQRGDVTRQKYEGILSENPFFENIFYDDLDPSPSVTPGATDRVGMGKYSLWLPERDSGTVSFDTDVVDVSTDGNFNIFRVHWDVYSLSRDTQDERNFLYYTEVEPDLLNVSISNDGGATFTSVFFMEYMELEDAGSDIVLRFEYPADPSFGRLYIGSYAVLY